MTRLRIWQFAVPARVRVGIDERVLGAVTGLAIAWKWPMVASLLPIGFEALLRPGELAILRRGDIHLPVDGQGLPTSVVVAHLRVPKTRHRAARRQSVVI